jgi:hypothetical protein
MSKVHQSNVKILFKQKDTIGTTLMIQVVNDKVGLSTKLEQMV